MAQIESGEGPKASRGVGAEPIGGGIVVDVTVASFEEMEPIYDGLARRAQGIPRP